MTSYELSLEDIESEISKIDSEIEFEKRYHKLINSKDFKEIFIDSIFGTELKELSDDMLEGYLEDCLSYILICYSSKRMTVRGVWIVVDNL